GHGVGGGTGWRSGPGRGRLTAATPTGVAFGSPPMRTDANGRVTIHVPLGDVETTWRIALVGVPDGATPATTTLDVPSQLPLSARVEAGSEWIEGDTADALVVVRNRTQKAARATLAMSTGGDVPLDGPRERSLDVPANGQTTLRVRMTARRAGEAVLAITTRAPGLPDDVMRHAWRVRMAGEPVDLAHIQWVDGETDLSRYL